MSHRIVNFDRDEELARARTQRNAWRWSARCFALALISALGANVGMVLNHFGMQCAGLLGVLVLLTAGVLAAFLPQFHSPRIEVAELDNNPFTRIRKP